MYNQGDLLREKIAEMIEHVVENEIVWPDSVTVEIQRVALPWITFLTALRNGQLGWFIYGGDFGFPNPDLWVTGFMHTQKGLAYSQHVEYGHQPMNWHPQGNYGQTGLPYYNYNGELVTEINNTYVDGLIEKAVAIPDPILRERCYTELMDIYYAECASRMTCQPYGERHYERKWVHGWFYHPCIHPGLMFYGEMNLWKEDPGTVTRDVAVTGSAAEGSWTLSVTVTNLGENPEFSVLNITYWNASGSPIVLTLITEWLPPGGTYRKTVSLTGAGTWGIAFKLNVGLNWVNPIQDSNPGNNKYALATTKVLGDLGSGVPPKFFAFDGKVNSSDLALFIRLFRGINPFADP